MNDLDACYLPDEEARVSIVEWLVDTTLNAAFGEKASELSREGAIRALGELETVVREPMNLEARISRSRSIKRGYDPDFYVEFSRGDDTLGRGTARTLQLAIMHAVRSVAQTTGDKHGK